MAARREDMTLDWEKLSREDLVKEYFETRLASLVNHIGVDWRWMPSDVSQDPIYWKMKDESLHDMHYEIARRYNITRDDCLWLENIVDSINLYLTDRKLKPLIEDAIKRLEKLEEEYLKREEKDKAFLEAHIATTNSLIDKADRLLAKATAIKDVNGNYKFSHKS